MKNKKTFSKEVGTYLLIMTGIAVIAGMWIPHAVVFGLTTFIALSEARAPAKSRD